ncbi:NAD-dependent epimerase/dehydratase family protein [Candidatus Woesearchaeota archaeon]|jgi:CDP-paratose 2-epimerase|nr:NAD-dependent epimerase/dehydratase family protein [Candidatus Woesearchaeota archaeon]MBT4764992.1 NAD-dependent epimerase/dehydratase family protein [bacterium]MBT7557310.1 NAD-dependent epimerase/dehydratase family protein [Candidatus Woesearchaeota archaeon]
MRYLITGGCGFLGSNLASEVLRIGGDLFIFDNLSRTGSEENLLWLKTLGEFRFYHGDIRVSNDIEFFIKDIKPDIIFHLAGQVAMTLSLENPRKDFEINTMGSLNLLESVRKYSPNSIVVYSSTNKVYGDLEYLEYIETKTRYEIKNLSYGIDEKTSLDFRSPYGCSKGAADQYMLDYARNFNIRTVVFRHSTIFGGRQFSTYDQGWIGWFVEKAVLRKKNLSVDSFSISGDGKQVRDILFTSDLINCYFLAVKNIKICCGKSYNIGGGLSNSLSLIELFNILESELNVNLLYHKIPWRANDQKVFIADIRKAYSDFLWTPKVNKKEGIIKMIRWIESLYE